MVRAILNGQKTQTRRVVKRVPPEMDFYGIGDGFADFYVPNGYSHTQINCPFGQVGDRLWVRETFGHLQDEDGAGYVYRANIQDDTEEDFIRQPWKPSIFMPIRASRILLEITDIRVERLQDITEADAIAEGIIPDKHGWYPNYLRRKFWKLARFDSVKHEGGAHQFLKTKYPSTSYATLWEEINGLYSWNANPFVWVISFIQL